MLLVRILHDPISWSEMVEAVRVWPGKQRGERYCVSHVSLSLTSDLLSALQQRVAPIEWTVANGFELDSSGIALAQGRRIM